MYNTLDVNLLLNIGPRGDGGIEQEQVDVLLEIGERIRQEGYPVAEGDEKDRILRESQAIIDRKILQRIHAKEFGPLRNERRRLSMQRETDEYKEVVAKLNRLTDVTSPENIELLDQWYEEHPAEWFTRYEQDQ
jgi:hypothetical protein